MTATPEHPHDNPYAVLLAQLDLAPRSGCSPARRSSPSGARPRSGWPRWPLGRPHRRPRAAVHRRRPPACCPTPRCWPPRGARTAHEVGELLAEEAQRQQIHVVLGPTINLHRSPLGGRLFEAYSEDPLLTGLLAAAYVRGCRSTGIGACLKHLVANEAETERHTVNSTVGRAHPAGGLPPAVRDRRRRRRPVVGHGRVQRRQRPPATEQGDINNGILKGEWGWDGLLMSDWFATQSAAPAANGGLDLVMPGPEGPWGEALVDAVEAGAVAPSVLDDHVRRLLRLADRVGALGEPRTWPTDLPEPDDAVRRDQLLRLAASGMTVLTNDGTLPLAHDTEIALIGRHALETTCMGGGSAQVPPRTRSASPTASATGSATTSRSSTAWRSARDPGAAAAVAVTDPVTGTPGDADPAVRRERHADQGCARRRGAGPRRTGRRPSPPGAPRCCPPASRRRAQASGCSASATGPSGSATSRRPQRCRAGETDDVGEAVLRPPGWRTDVVLAERTDLTAEVGLQGIGAVAWSPSRPRRPTTRRSRPPCSLPGAPRWRSSWSG